jgi:site-specific DNA-cytosine methylase
MNHHVFTALFPFCGLGAGALGFLNAQVTVCGVTASFRSVGGIDGDTAGCHDFEYLTKSPSLNAYVGDAPPPHWVRRKVPKLTAKMLRAFAGDKAPDVVFMSPPCKGASGLLSAEKAKTKKYKDMNRLAVVWTKLMFEAWSEGPALILLENVPRLRKRAADMVRELRSVLRAKGYVFSDGFHDCGEIGALAQHRQRYLLVARLPKRAPALLYEPPKLKVRPCGAVLRELPMPEDAAGGPMHRLPTISWLNWVRLALIPAGGDWRDIPGVLAEGQARRTLHRRHRIESWNEPAATIAGSGSNAVNNIADPRLEFDGASRDLLVGGKDNAFGNVDRVTGWDQAAPTVTSSPAPSSGAVSVADPRLTLDGAFNGVYGVNGWDEPSDTITGRAGISTGRFAVADVRLGCEPRAGAYGLLGWREAARTITGHMKIDNATAAVADPRIEEGRPILCVSKAYDHGYGVLHWREPSPTVAAGSHPGQGAYSVADPRVPDHQVFVPPANPKDAPEVVPIILAEDGCWHRPLTTYELAMLQGMPSHVDGKPLCFHGKSSSAWRERIGNAVPPPTAKAIATRMLVTLVGGATGAWSLNGDTGVWVDAPDAIAPGWARFLSADEERESEWIISGAAAEEAALQ